MQWPYFLYNTTLTLKKIITYLKSVLFYSSTKSHVDSSFIYPIIQNLFGLGESLAITPSHFHWETSLDIEKIKTSHIYSIVWQMPSAMSDQVPTVVNNDDSMFLQAKLILFKLSILKNAFWDVNKSWHEQTLSYIKKMHSALCELHIQWVTRSVGSHFLGFYDFCFRVLTDFICIFQDFYYCVHRFSF